LKLTKRRRGSPDVGLPIVKDLFPDPRNANEDGIVCIGGPLAVPVLVTAYYNGIFPWPHQGLPLLWFSPPERGVLEFNNLHVGRTLKRSMKKYSLSFTLNKAFKKVMDECAKAPRRGQLGTWITPEMKRAYSEMQEQGFALSLEAWDENKLVGGIYGVFVAGVFSAESMFGLKSDISKICVVEMVNYLRRLNLTWMDIQMVTSVSGSLGGTEISRDDFLLRLEASHKLFTKKKILLPDSVSLKSD
jgi:leucyl/phenylalanyl-tRNA---protein transferase